MPLVNVKPVLREGKAKGYTVAAFNPVDYASMKTMIVAAKEIKAPVIIQTSAKTINYYGHAALAGWMQEPPHSHSSIIHTVPPERTLWEILVLSSQNTSVNCR